MPPDGRARDVLAGREQGVALSPLRGLVLVLAVASLFTMSGGVLWDLGLNYDGLTGSPLSKIHPGTYLICLLFAWSALASGNPMSFAARMVRARPASAFLLAAAAIVLAGVALRGTSGLSGTVDTFMLPALVVMLLAGAGTVTFARLERVMHATLAANAALGLFEFVTDNQLFPYRFDGTALIYDHRSMALQGHPLANATVTAIYVLALLAGGGALRPASRSAMVVLQLLALVTFGGRIALVTVALLGGGYSLIAAGRTLRRGAVPLIGVAAGVLLLTMAPLLAVALAAGGFFDAIAARFMDDGGSANARAEMLDLLAAIPMPELFIGPDVGLVDTLRRRYGLELGIENPIVADVLYLGAVLTLLLTVALVLFFREIVRAVRPGVWLPLLGFLVVLNTSESIASKTTVITSFSVMMIVLFRRPEAAQAVSPSAATTSRSSARVASSMRPIPSNRFQKAHGKP